MTREKFTGWPSYKALVRELQTYAPDILRRIGTRHDERCDREIVDTGETTELSCTCGLKALRAWLERVIRSG
jgi:hypothetical protein